MATRIYPSENDVGVNAGDGNLGTEENLTFWSESFERIIRMTQGSGASIKSVVGGLRGGFEVTATSGLQATLASGTAIIDGYTVQETASNEIALTANSHNHVFYRLDKTSGLASGATFVVNATSNFSDLGIVPAESALLYDFVTSGSGVATTYDYRLSASGVCVGSYTGDGTDNHRIGLAFRPKLVIVTRKTAPRLWSISEIGHPVQSGGNVGLCHIEHDASTDEVVTRITQDTALRAEHLISPDDGFRVDGVNPPTLAANSRGDVLSVSQAYDPPILSVGDVDTEQITVTGAEPGDHAVAHFDGVNSAGLLESATVTAANTVVYRLENQAGAFNVGSGVLDVRVTKAESNSPWVNTVQTSLNDSGDTYYFCAWA